MTINEIVKTKYPEIYGKYHIRFELGGELKNGTKKRIKQTVSRALEIFNQTFVSNDLHIIIEEYSNEFFDQNGKNKNHIYSLIKEINKEKIKGPFEQSYFETNPNGELQEIIDEDLLECDLIFYNTNKSDIDIEKVITGKANLEMGFEPSIPQDIVFYSPSTTNCMHMYDDRGCDIWSTNKEKLLSIYLNLNSWILDYNRKEIDIMFN